MASPQRSRSHKRSKKQPINLVNADTMTAAPPDLAILGSQLKVVEGERELLEPYAKFREAPVHALQEFGLHVLGTGWRRYENFVGQEMFYSGFTERMKGLVLRQPMLQRKISELAQRRVEAEIQEGTLGPIGAAGEVASVVARRKQRKRTIEQQLNQVADEWTDKMICKLESKYFIRGAYYMVTQLLTRAYHQGIHVSSQEVLHLTDVAREAAKKKQSIIFLPCHRSHVDYISLQVICYRLGLALPTVVAGDNLNFPLVGSFLQNAGAFYIRRSFGDDQLYNTLVQTYIDTLLQNGFNIECFVEGGRSRTGKLLQPKFGILSFVLESLLSGRVEDALVCPVSTQYDKVIEVDSYISELLGQPKKKEDLSQFLSASNVLSLKLGRIDVRFHKPYSLRDFINEQRARFTTISPAGEELSASAMKRKILTTLAYKVLKDINDVSVVMPTALVGTVLLTLTGRSVGRSELARRVLWLAERVIAQGGRIAHVHGNEVDSVINKALGVLGPKLVGRVDGLPEEMYYAEDRFQLSFYRNMTIHLFITQSLVCAAMYTKVKLGGGAEIERMSYAELHAYVFFLSQLFRAEFIFPTTPFDENLRNTLQGLADDHVLDLRFSDLTQEIEFISIHTEERATDMENFDFYCFLIWPFIEASWLGAISLFMLSPPVGHSDKSDGGWLDMKTFQDKAQLLGKTLYHRGDLSYYEAVNKEALKNAIGNSEEEGTILVTRDKGQPQRVRLHAEYLPARDAKGHFSPEGRLWAFCERINQSRRDAENRKEGESVQRRILGLAESIGKDLYENASSEAGGKVAKMRRRQGIAKGAKL